MGSVPSKICPKRGSPAARPSTATHRRSTLRSSARPASKASSFGCSDETLAIKLADDFPPESSPRMNDSTLPVTRSAREWNVDVRKDAVWNRTGLLAPCVDQRDHEAFADRLGIAHEGFHRRVGALSRFEFRECGAVHAGQLGQVAKA
jgi:hypothetical protein